MLPAAQDRERKGVKLHQMQLVILIIAPNLRPFMFLVLVGPDPGYV